MTDSISILGDITTYSGCDKRPLDPPPLPPFESDPLKLIAKDELPKGYYWEAMGAFLYRIHLIHRNKCFLKKIT